MLKILKQNIKYLKKKYKINEIIGINDQSLRNMISDETKRIKLEYLILIHQATNISTDDLLFKDLEKEELNKNN